MKAYLTGQGVWQASQMRNGKRITFYLGKKIDGREAHRLASILTKLLDVSSGSWKVEYGREFHSLPDGVRNSLQRHFGFFRQTDLEFLFDKHYETTAGLAEKTRSRYRNWYAHMKKYFVETSPLLIKVEEVVKFRQWCFDELGHSESTVSRGMRTCKTIFKFGEENGYLLQNPFKGVSMGIEVNESRMFYVDRLEFGKVLEVCRNDRERLILVLARYGGLRIPSEISRLRFDDITETLIRIHCATKTGYREVPLFSEVRELVSRIRGKPDELVFPEFRRNRSREILKRALQKLGKEMWPKPFVNMRSSCITDFVTIGYTEKALDSMFGNSARVRERHYVQFRKDFEYRRMLEDDRSLSDYLRYCKEEGEKRQLEPLVIRELVLAQRIANKANLW